MSYTKTKNWSSFTRQLRNYYGKTQQEFAEIMGVATATVYRLEKGRAQPNQLTQRRLLELAQKPYQQLAEELAQARPTNSPTNDLSKSVQQQMGGVLNPEIRDALENQFQQDVATKDGTEFWLMAGLIGLGYLLLKQED